MAADPEWIPIAVDAAPLLVGLLFTATFLVAGVRLLRAGVTIGRSDPIPAEEVYRAEGAVEVEGIAETAVETLSAPASETECLGYVHEIAAKVGERHDQALIDDDDPGYDRGDEHRGGWTTVEREHDLVPFYVADDSGEILVDGDADLYLGDDERIPDEEDNRAHREQRLEPGDPVHVYGQRRDVVEARGGFPDERVFVGTGDDVEQAKVTVGDEREVVLKRLLLGGVLTLFAGGATVLLGRELLTIAGVL